jgi:hypothetical protein
MLIKLQKRTIVLSQIIGYALALLVGVTILLLVTQLYFDIKPLLTNQTDVFKSKAAVISKNISVFKSIKRERVYFNNEEIDELRKQSFVKNIAKFNSATFKINAYSNKSESVPVFYTDLFFESIPDIYLDVKTDEWKWNASLDFIPIIIPENYLNLYNFGFAESQGLPVLSKNTISQIEFNIQISGHHRTKDYKSKIVGFSNKVNSILVPEDFLLWANNEFGRQNNISTSRILVEFNDPSDKNILKYFNEHNYSINKEELEFSKLVFFFKSALIFVFLIADVIIFISISFILLSFNLIIERNKELLLNLYNIGYNYTQIAKFYQLSISLITVFSILASIIISYSIRNYYLAKIINLFDFSIGKNHILLLGALLILILGIAYNVLIIKNIKTIVIPRKDK